MNQLRRRDRTEALDFGNQRGKCRHMVVRPDPEIGMRDPARGRHSKRFRE